MKDGGLEPHEDLCHPRPTATSADDQDMDDPGRCQRMRQWLRNGPVLLRMDISHLGYPVRIGGSVDTGVALHEQSIQP